MGENSIGKTAIGKVTSFNPITKDGLIVVKKTKENVVIQDRANKKDSLIFTLKMMNLNLDMLRLKTKKYIFLID